MNVDNNHFYSVMNHDHHSSPILNSGLKQFDNNDHFNSTTIRLTSSLSKNFKLREGSLNNESHDAKKNGRTNALMNALKLCDGPLKDASTTAKDVVSPIVLSKKNKSSYTYSLRKTILPLFVPMPSFSDDEPISSSVESSVSTIHHDHVDATNERHVRFYTNSSEQQEQHRLPTVIVVNTDRSLSGLTPEEIEAYEEELMDRGYEKPPRFFAKRSRTRSKHCHSESDECNDTATTASCSSSSTSSDNKLIRFYRRREYRMKWRESQHAVDEIFFKKESSKTIDTQETQAVAEHNENQKLCQEIYSLFRKANKTNDRDCEEKLNDSQQVFDRWVQTDGRGLERPLVLRYLQQDKDEVEDSENAAHTFRLNDARRCPQSRLTADLAHQLALADEKLVKLFYSDENGK